VLVHQSAPSLGGLSRTARPAHRPQPTPKEDTAPTPKADRARTGVTTASQLVNIYCYKTHRGVASNAGRHCVAIGRAVAEGRRDAEVATAGLTRRRLVPD
jgi:hypothetical protein